MQYIVWYTKAEIIIQVEKSVFSGSQFPMLPSICSQHLYNMTLVTMLIKIQLRLVQNVQCIFKDNLTEGLDFGNFGNKKSQPFTVYKQNHVMHNVRLLLETVQ